MNNLPDKDQIKDLILNDIKKKICDNISNGDTTITIPVYVYDMFKNEFEDKGYTIIKKENDNYNISIPLLKNDKKDITKDIFEKIIDNKQFDELLNYVNFDLTYYFGVLLRNCKYENILKYVIDNTIDLECKNDFEQRPIHWICVYSTPEMIKYIIDKGVNLECENKYKMRPIHIICKNSTPEMIKYIIDKGVNLEYEDCWEWRPIHLICAYSTPEMIKYIIDKEIKLNFNDELELENFINENDKISDKDEMIEYINKCKHVMIKKAIKKIENKIN